MKILQKKNILKKLFGRNISEHVPSCEASVSSGRLADNGVNLLTLQREGFNERQLYDNLRSCVPIVDAALQKIVRLTGCYKVVCSDSRFQSEMDDFVENVPVGTGEILCTLLPTLFLTVCLLTALPRGKCLLTPTREMLRELPCTA